MREKFQEKPEYYDISWRLDIEIARRNVRNMYLPTYIFKIDTISTEKNHFVSQNSKIADVNDLLDHSQNDGSDSISVRNRKRNLESINVQCDYINLKNMEIEIQKALNSLKIVNSQTVVNYES